MYKFLLNILDQCIAYLLKKLNKKQISTVFVAMISIIIWCIVTLGTMKHANYLHSQSIKKLQQQIGDLNIDVMRMRIGMENGYYLTKHTELAIADYLLRYNKYCGIHTRISILECKTHNMQFECRFWYHIRYYNNTYQDLIRMRPVIEDRLLKWQSADTVLTHLMTHNYVIMSNTELKVFFSELDQVEYSDRVQYITNTVISRHKTKPYLILVRSEFNIDDIKCNEAMDKHRAEEILHLIQDQK